MPRWRDTWSQAELLVGGDSDFIMSCGRSPGAPLVTQSLSSCEMLCTNPPLPPPKPTVAKASKPWSNSEP